MGKQIISYQMCHKIALLYRYFKNFWLYHDTASKEILKVTIFRFHTVVHFIKVLENVENYEKIVFSVSFPWLMYT